MNRIIGAGSVCSLADHWWTLAMMYRLGRYFATCFSLLNMMSPLGHRMTYSALVKNHLFSSFSVLFFSHIVIKYLLSLWNLLGSLPNTQLPLLLWLHSNSERHSKMQGSWSLARRDRCPSSFKKPGSGWRQKGLIASGFRKFLLFFRDWEDFYPVFLFSWYSSFGFVHLYEIVFFRSCSTTLVNPYSSETLRNP